MVDYSFSIEPKLYDISSLIAALEAHQSNTQDLTAKENIGRKITALHTFAADAIERFVDRSVALRDEELGAILYNDYLTIEHLTETDGVLISSPSEFYQSTGQFYLGISTQIRARAEIFFRQAREGADIFRSTVAIARYTKPSFKRAATDIVVRPDEQPDSETNLLASLLLTVDNKLDYAAGVIEAVAVRFDDRIAFGGVLKGLLVHAFTAALQQATITSSFLGGSKIGLNNHYADPLIEKSVDDVKEGRTHSALKLHEKILQQVDAGMWPEVEETTTPNNVMYNAMRDSGMPEKQARFLAAFAQEVFAECIEVLQAPPIPSVETMPEVGLPATNVFYLFYQKTINAFSGDTLNVPANDGMTAMDPVLAQASGFYSDYLNRILCSSYQPSRHNLWELESGMRSAALPREAVAFLRFQEGAIAERWEHRAAATLERELPQARERIPGLIQQLDAFLLQVSETEAANEAEYKSMQADINRLHTLLHISSVQMGQLNYYSTLYVDNCGLIERNKAEQVERTERRLSSLQTEQQLLGSTIEIWEQLRQTVMTLPEHPQGGGQWNDRALVFLYADTRNDLKSDLEKRNETRGSRPWIFGKTQYDRDTAGFAEATRLLSTLQETCQQMREERCHIDPDFYAREIVEAMSDKKAANERAAKQLADYTTDYNNDVQRTIGGLWSMLRRDCCTLQDAINYRKFMTPEQSVVLRTLLANGPDGLAVVPPETILAASSLDATKSLEANHRMVATPLWARQREIKQSDLDLARQRSAVQDSLYGLTATPMESVEHVSQLRQIQDIIARAEQLLPEDGVSSHDVGHERNRGAGTLRTDKQTYTFKVA